MQTVNSSKLEWLVIPAGCSDDFQAIYCADGDGFVELVESASGFTLLDQGEFCASWPKLPDPQNQLHGLLEIAQDYLAASYNAIFQDFRLDK